MENTICISITDAHDLTRNAIKHYLNSIANFQVIIDTASGNDLLKKLSYEHPKICLLEVNLPDSTGLDVLLQIKKAKGTLTKVLMLSSYNSPIIIAKHLKNGASGYVLKQEAPDYLVEAINQVHNGGIYVPRSLTRKFTKRAIRQTDYSISDMSISKREYLFLSYCNSELTYKEIASKMFISPRTLEGYRDSLFKKLNVKSRIGLALYAANSGISL